jgi:hypothetical protein
MTSTRCLASRQVALRNRGQEHSTVESQQPAGDILIKWVDPTSDRFGARLGVEIQTLDPVVGGEGNRPTRLGRIRDP